MEYYSLLLDSEKLRIVNSLKNNASILLDIPHRFKYFTLHGSQHIDNMLSALDLLIEGGLELKAKDLYLLTCAICVHDLGMVCRLSEIERRGVVDGSVADSEPPVIENYIRSMHHELIDDYMNDSFGFLVRLGVSPPDLSMIKNIARCHRRIDLYSQAGAIKPLGALLRLIDELVSRHYYIDG